MSDLATRRLAAQRLTGQPFESAVEAVRRLGALQSQDYSGAKWALGLRTGATERELDQLYDEGSILRTHVLRPTWHFVLPEDIHRLLRLTGPRVRAGMAGRHRARELDAATIARAIAAFEASLADGRHLTRAELGEAVAAAGISPAGQRIPHLLTCAELEGVVTSGPRRGKQLTWALMAERAPATAGFDREETLVDLTRRYFQSHGPAQLADYLWWSGLSAPEARAGLQAAAVDLEEAEIEGKRYWWGAGADPRPRLEPPAHLLPNFDEYLVAYRDRSAALPPGPPPDPSLFSFGSILSNVILVDGRVRGAWRKTVRRGSVFIELRPSGDVEAAERDAIERAAERARRFFAS